jgi:Tfp pilus assembly protein PilF
MDAKRHDAAYAALRARRFERALVLFDQLATEAPDDPDVLFGRTLALISLGDEPEATDELRRLEAAAPDHPLAHYLAARFAWRRGLLDQAQQSFEEALAVTGRNTEVLVDYANFLALERGPRVAEQVAHECLKASPEAPEAWLALGRVRMRQGRVPEASMCFQRALELDPGHSDAQAEMSAFLATTGRLEEAEALLKLVADHPEAVEFAKQLRRHLKERRQSLSLYSRKEFRDEALKPPMGVRWVQRFWSWWTVMVLLAIAVCVVLAFTEGNPLLVGPIAGFVVGLWLLRKWLD